MSDLGFRVEGNKAFVIRGDNEKEISRDTVIQVYQLLLSSISPNRDYTTITSNLSNMIINFISINIMITISLITVNNFIKEVILSSFIIYVL